MNLTWRVVALALIVEPASGLPAQAQGVISQIFSQPVFSGAPAARSRPVVSEPNLAQRSKSKSMPKTTPKPPKKFVWNAPVNPPLPPLRPWSNADAVFDAVAQVFVSPLAASTFPDTAMGEGEAEPVVAQIEASTSQLPVSRVRSLVLIVRDGVREPGDLQGRRIATGLTGEPLDELQRMVEESVGVHVSPVTIGWSAGLNSLARGEVDGVLLSLGPRVAASETEGVMLAGYQLLEIPVAAP